MENGIGHRTRLRQRFDKTGFNGFAEHEALELLLTLAIPRRDVKPQAKAMLAKFGSLRGVLDAPPDKLRKIPGIGTVAPLALRIVREAATLYLQQGIEQRPVLQRTEDLSVFWLTRLGGMTNEVFEVGYLDSSLCLLRDGVERLEEGTIDRAVVYPRRVMEAALNRRAAAIVLAHNHPNGDPTPSTADKDLTRALVLASATLQIRVVDHLIVGATKVFSFAEEGLL